MTTLASDKISTFPSSMRTQDVYSRFTTERNLVNMVNDLIDYDGYVYKLQVGNTRTLEIVLGGYFFSMKLEDIVPSFSSSTAIYAYIIVGFTTSSSGTEAVGSEIGDSRLVGWDGTGIKATVDYNSNFIGLNFTDDERNIPIAGTTPGLEADVGDFRVYSLKVLERPSATDQASWTVPSTSYRKFGVLSDSEVDGIFESSEPLEESNPG